jgi:hypothetical protein
MPRVYHAPRPEKKRFDPLDFFNAPPRRSCRCLLASSAAWAPFRRKALLLRRLRSSGTVIRTLSRSTPSNVAVTLRRDEPLQRRRRTESHINYPNQPPMTSAVEGHLDMERFRLAKSREEGLISAERDGYFSNPPPPRFQRRVNQSPSGGAGAGRRAPICPRSCSRSDSTGGLAGTGPLYK